MTSAPPRRPWWKRKWTWATVAVWLLVAYPLSVGPTVYAEQRGWLSTSLCRTAEEPVYAVAAPLGMATALVDYQQWWIWVAINHELGPDAGADPAD